MVYTTPSQHNVSTCDLRSMSQFFLVMYIDLDFEKDKFAQNLNERCVFGINIHMSYFGATGTPVLDFW